ncbi:MAG: signal peptidase II [Oscillospiraceae bacterium]|nr:signal peptidase II [Oscillospiraceae bacterium]
MTILFWCLCLVLALIDRGTKAAAERLIEPGSVNEVIKIGDRRILWFTLHHNTGAAFSSFTGKTAMLSVVTVILLLIVAVYFHKNKKRLPETIAMAMIFGGGLGNLFDRIVYGQVTDFINLFPFDFIFNFADICVVLGVIFLIIVYLFLDKDDKPKDTPGDGDTEHE